MGPVAINAVVAADASGRITQFNPAAQRTFGWAEADVLDRSVTTLICESDRHTYRQHVEQFARRSGLLDTCVVRDISERKETERQRSDLANRRA